jgi:hypothetical protein
MTTGLALLLTLALAPDDGEAPTPTAPVAAPEAPTDAPEPAPVDERQHDAPPPQDEAPHVKLQTVIIGIEARRDVDPELAEALSDVVQGVYARDDSRIVLGTSDIRRVLGFEAQRQAAGCSDDSCLSELAAALDADRLVTGSIDRIGDTWLFVLTEIDARSLRPIERTEHQLPISEERLPLAVRELTTAVVKGEPVPVIAPEDGEVPWFHWVFATSKLAAAAAAVPAGGMLVFAGAIYSFLDDNANPTTPTFEDGFIATVLCFAPGAVCCTIGAGLVVWAIFDFVDPPRRATHVIGAREPDEEDARFVPPRYAGATAEMPF